MDELLGRDPQAQALTDILRDPARPARSLVLEGEPGIGKTVLVRRAVAEASDTGYWVLEASPVEAETGLALAGIGDLLEPALHAMLPALPDPQRAALEVALLMRSDAGRRPNQRALGLAVYHGLQALARHAPVLVVIDDAHWLDATSADLLRFAFRRLRAEPVAVVLARRPADGPHGTVGGLDSAGLPPGQRIELGPLSMGAIHGLVGERLAVNLPRPVLRRIHELSRGNPLYALELARGYRDGTLGLDLGDALALDLGSVIGGRIGRMPARAREALATAAAASRPTLGLIGAALPGTDARASLLPAVRSGVVALAGDDVLFSHPLLASAALGLLGPDGRRACHARLAGVVDDPVEGARHRALAATSPDAAVAAQVEGAAMHTRARGAASGAAELMALAVRLTPPDDPARGRRRLTEAEFRMEAGDAPGASAMLERLLADTAPGPGRATVLARLAHFHNLAADTGGGIDLLRQALAEAAPDDPVRGEVHESLAWALVLARHDMPTALEHAHAAVDIMARGDDPAALSLALAMEALVRTLLGLPDEGQMERALAIEPPHQALAIRSRPTHANGYRLTCLDELDDADRTYATLLARAMEQGDESAPSHLLGRRSVVRMLLGDLVGAEGLATEAAELSSQTGQLPTQAAAMGRLALIVARRGDLGRAHGLARRSLDLASSGPVADRATTSADAWLGRPHARGGESALWALGHVALCEGRFDDAAAAFATLTDPILACGVREPGEMRWLFDEVEALVLAGRMPAAHARTTLLMDMATATGRRSGRVAGLAAQGVVRAADGDLDGSLDALEAAATLAEGSPLPFERGQTLLALGRVQRRLAHKRDARTTLEGARDQFQGIGARHWATAAGMELARIGGRSGGGSELTESEHRVIDLVTRGLSNKEVAAALFVTPKAVEASLSRIYLKRGIRSRTELAALMLAAGPGSTETRPAHE